MSIFSTVSSSEIMLFTKHIGVMLKAGIPISEAIDTIAEQTSNKSFKNILNQISNDVMNGQSFEKSLSKYPRVFDPIYLSLIRTGEGSGTLEENMEFLASQLNKNYQFREKVKSASLYPAIVLFVGFTISAYISIFVLPKLVDLYKSMDIALPKSTVVLLWVAGVMQKYGYFIFGGIAVLYVLFRLSLLIKPIKFVWDLFLLKIPTLGTFIQNREMAGVCRNLGIMLRSGVPIVKSLDTIKNATGNKVYQKYINDIKISVAKGSSISDEVRIKKYHLLPSIMKKMIGVGEKTGKLDETLLYLGEYYENEVDNTMRNISSIIEPVLLFVIGGIVAFLAIAIVSPIYKFTGSIGSTR